MKTQERQSVAKAAHSKVWTAPACWHFVFLLIALPVMAETNVCLRVTLDLSDGSRVVGTPGITTLAVRAAFGNVNVPLANVGRVELGKEQTALTLRNGDRVTGTLDLPVLELATVFGKVTVPVGHIREFRVATMRGGPAPRGLTLWNTLDSQAEIETSRFGPGGTFKGGEFGEGKHGRAFVVRHDQPLQVTFPIEVVKATTGCIEFWAKLTGFPEQLAWGQNPTLIRAGSATHHYLLHFNGNDGASRGGLCANAVGGAGTGQFGTWTYTQVLGAGTVADWHHYALVWDKDGIAGLDGRPTVAVFLDGRLHCSGTVPADAEVTPFQDGELGLLYNQHLRQGKIAFDNLKVWDYAKTEFNDRNEE
jgi:hypothetical protein